MKTDTEKAIGEIKRKIGRNRGKRRLWLEGACLSAFGWSKGDRFNATFENGCIIYEKDLNGQRAVAGTEGTRPIIDTNTDKIGQALGNEAEQVKIQVTTSRIIIKVACLIAALASVFFNVLPANAKQVLIACEYSGVVSTEFRKLGHDAISCDILPTDGDCDHIQGDVSQFLNKGWDMIIAFPPCTFLCSSQLWRCNLKHDPTQQRKAKQEKALLFVQSIMGADCPQIAIENPVGCISTRIRKPDQKIQPYQFGHDVSKNTCLWLKGLNKLFTTPEKLIAPRLIEYKGKIVKRWGNQSPCGADKSAPSESRGKDRSRTYAGIAQSMALQWGGLMG